VHVDSRDDSTSWDGFAITTDTGATWFWLVRAVRYLSGLQITIDPKDKIVYLAINATNNLAEANENFLLLRISPWAVSVPEYELIHHDRFAWPNPASSFLHIRCIDCSNVVVDVIDVLGRGVENAVVSMVSDADHEMIVDVRSIPQGSYLVRLSKGDDAWSIPVVILR